MESLIKGLRPSKLDACIENITRTLVQRSQDERPHHSTNQNNFYRTETCHNSNDNDNSIKIKIRKVGTYQTPEELKPYECPICHKKISNQANLRTHIRTHTGDKPHRCGICGKSFSRNGTLQTHLTIHSGVKLFKCEICGREIRDRGNLSKHMKIHLSNIVPKKETGPINESQIYIPKTDMEIISNSIKEATKKGLDAMNTSQLDLIKNEIYALNNSQLENMAKQEEVRTESRVDTPKVQNKSNNDSFLMSEKGGNSSSSSSSKEDKNLEEETPVDKNLPKSYSKKNCGLPYERNRHSQDNVISYNCGLCLIAFSNTDSYFSHMMAHARDQRYRRRGPDYMDDEEGSLTKHKQQLKQEMAENLAAPGEQEMFAAYEREMRAWDQRFNQRGHDVMDIQEIDLSKNTQLLKQVKQGIVDPVEQEMLDAYETELKAYHAQKIKQDEGNLKSTREQKMMDADEQNTTLEEKRKEKSIFKCGICGNEYKTKDSFEDHITIHKVDKPYQCTICLEQFKELRYLQKHIRGHRGLNPYWCEKCGKEFSQSIYLIEHLQTHASDEQPCSSNMNGDFNNRPTKIPHPRQPQGDSQDMFIVIE